MFGPRIRNVFRSRWQALWWAASILATAYCTVPAADEAGQAVQKQQAPHKHINPWAKTAR